MDYSKIERNIQKKLRDYCINNDIKALVLGVSGGVDSAVVAALAKPVCDNLNIKLYGRSIPILTNKMDEIERAQKIGRCFCHDFKEVDLGAMFHEFSREIEDEEGCLDDGRRDKIRQGNIKARMRMIYLYNLAFIHRGMVLGTDNLTEYNLGFWTLHGDVGDYGMIQNLWKGEVYNLARHIVKKLNEKGKTQEVDALEDCIIATPTDGLGITSSDLEQLEARTYEEVDRILQSSYITDNPIIKRHLNSEFKRHNPYNISRSDLLNEQT
ncbi:MAG: NAD(+) synthase [Candidatus Woesearchaeota archaeon]